MDTLTRDTNVIPLCDLRYQYQTLQKEIDAAIQEVSASGQYVLGPNVKALEAEMADYCGANYAIGVGSGTDALYLSLRALDIGPGDEVITSPFTFIGTTEAICMTGATPVFADIDPSTFNIDPLQIDKAISPSTKAILPVHLYGQPCEMDVIAEIAARHSLCIVEDCAQAVGAEFENRKVGTWGDAGCFSFFPSKNLGCFGDGGMVVTDDVDVYERVEMLRRHGGKVKYHHTELGVNSRLDELQASILRVKLPYLDEWNQSRRRCAYTYNQLLEKLCQVKLPAELGTQTIFAPTGTGENERIRATYHQYTVLLEGRDVVAGHLKKAGISNAIYYPVPLHLQEVHRNLNYQAGDFPNAERVSQQCLSLPMFPELSEKQQEAVSEVLAGYFAQGIALSRGVA